ncbi:MAG: AAA family ATPase [Isosphaeraceae bacterium]
MSIITVSRGTYSGGLAVATKLAQRLGYQCISREDIIATAACEFNIPEVKLLCAVNDPPSILDRFTYGKERYVAYIQAALLEHFQEDNVVYHGMAGHFFVQNVSHALKVRIVSPMEERVKLIMQRERISEEYAWRYIKGLDEARRKWGLHLYGIDTHDPTLYDLVVRTKKLTVDDCVEIICHTVTLDRFQATPQSQQAVTDLALAARVKVNLIQRHPRVQVAAQGHHVYITLEGATSRDEQEIHDIVTRIPGIRSITINPIPVLTPE